MKVCDNKSGSKYIRIVLILMFILLIGLILLSIKGVFSENTQTDNASTVTDTAQGENIENREDEETYINHDYEEAYYNDPYIEEVRYYNNVIVPRESCVRNMDIYCMCRYIRFTCLKFIDLPDDFDMANAIAESRGRNLYVYYNDISGYRQNVEIEVSTDNPSIYYVKFSNNQNDNITWYVFRLTQQKDTQYSVDHEKVEYDGIASKLTVLNNEISPLTNDRSYCEYVIEEQKEILGCDELYYEGMSEPLTADMLMQINGYTD